MRQADAFLDGEGDRYNERNRDAELNRSVVNAILSIGSKPANVLEVGCGNGRYLGELHKYYGGTCRGIDASHDAIAEALKAYPDVRFRCDDAINGMALEADIHARYDLIIFGFCLYLIDRDELFWAVTLADRLLKIGGHLVIHDFYPQYPAVVPYKHKKGLRSYKMKYPDLWLANPAYSHVSSTKIDDEVSVEVLQKTSWESMCVY